MTGLANADGCPCDVCTTGTLARPGLNATETALTRPGRPSPGNDITDTPATLWQRWINRGDNR